MGKLFDEVRKLADLENGLLPDGTVVKPWDVPEFMLNETSGAVRKLGKKDPQGVWDILRNGTEDEFSALINCIPEIGGTFDEDSSCCEIMQISKRRLAVTHDYDTLLTTIKAGFGSFFDQFWNESETEPVTKARTFNQFLQG